MPISRIAVTALALLALAAQAQEATLKKIKDSGSITLGHRESSFGFSYNDGSGKPVGYSIVDRVVGGMMQSGEMETLYRQWFMAPIPPKGANINYR